MRHRTNRAGLPDFNALARKIMSGEPGVWDPNESGRDGGAHERESTHWPRALDAEIGAAIPVMGGPYCFRHGTTACSPASTTTFAA